MSASAQGMAIVSMMLCGLAMGLVFDVYRVASHRFHVARWLLPALDVAYWAAATLGVFSILLGSNHGEVRMYVFLGLGIGVTCYFGLLSHVAVKLSGKLIDGVKGTARFLWKLIDVLLLTPFLWLVRLLAKLLDVVFIITAAILLWSGRLLFKPFSAIAKRLWPRLLPIRRAMRPWVQFFVRAGRRMRQIRELLIKKKK